MSGLISSVRALRDRKLRGVKVYPLEKNDPRRGQKQQVLVVVDPGMEIPLHSHSVDAHMQVVAGDAVVLAQDPKLNGKRVRLGHCVFFEKMKHHGFRAGANGLSFISTNDGIVDSQAAWDLQLA